MAYELVGLRMLLGAGHPASEVLSERVSPFHLSQRVLHLRHSFKVQNASTDSGDYIFWNFLARRTSARAARQNILRIHSKMAKKRIFIQILAHAARAEVRARQIFFQKWNLLN